MARLTLEGLRKEYDGGHVAVHGLDLDVADGEFVVLVGPSGCGKSTTLRMVAGLETITAGRLTIGGRVMNDVPPGERDIAMVFQSYALYPHMTAYRNMAFALELRRMPRGEIDRRVRAAADTLGLTGSLHRLPRQLSGGQRQRVAIGRAIVREPAVFLFDEPLSNLDATLRVHMRREIARLHRQLGATVLYVTHDQVEAMTMGDRILVMEAGHVRQVDTPMALYDRPRDLFVATFIGSPAMNLLPGILTVGGRGALFTASGGAPTLPLPSSISRGTAGEATLGLRPEHLRPAASAPAGTPTLDLLLDAVEPLGNEVLLHGRCGEHELTARVAPGIQPREGDVVTLAVEVDRAHLFDTDGRRLEDHAG